MKILCADFLHKKMHCSSCASLSSTNDAVLNEEEMQHMRLRRLLQEKILKIEKENLEAVQQELQKDLKKSNAQSEPKTKHTVKSLVHRKMKPNIKEQAFVRITSSTASKKVIESTDQQNCCSGNFNNEHSNIHFLNHFQSSLNASKAQLHLQRLETKARHLPNVPVFRNDFPPAPITYEKLQPSVKKTACRTDFQSTHNNFEKLQPSVKKTAKIANTAIHHITSRDTKKLTVQVLPSISIFENKPKVLPNVSLEEIREDNLTGASLPGQSSNFDSFHHSSKVATSRELNQHHPGKSVFTMTNNHLHNEALANNQNQLKTLVKEILYDLHISPAFKQHFDSKKGNTSSTEEVHVESSHCKKPENEIQHCCCHCKKEIKTVSTQTSMKCSTYVQTDDLTPLTTDNEDLRCIIREVMSEYQHIFTSIFNSKDKLIQLDKTRADKEVQTVLNVEVKEIQTSFVEDHLHHNQTMTPIVEELNHTSSKVEQTPGSCEIIKQMSQMASKIDHVMNVFNDHLCKTDDNAAKNFHRSTSSPSNITRDVSIQFSPQVISRGTQDCFLKRFTDVGNQCELLTSKENPNLVNAATQLSLKECFQYVEAFTQCENRPVAVIDECTQTRERASSLQGSCQSASSSTTSTPVNDTLFVDDSFSEGELPWHLRFLTYHQRSKKPSFDNIVDSSTPSEERDYSLSEGEIPPRYIQSKYDMHSSLEHSKKDRLDELNSNTVKDLSSNPHNSFNLHTQRKPYSNQEPPITSLFKEKMKPSTHLSTGEIHPSFHHYSMEHHSSKLNTVLPKNSSDYKGVLDQHTVSSNLPFDEGLKSCNHPSKSRGTTGYRNFSNVASWDENVSSTYEKRICIQSMEKKPTFKASGEKHTKSQSPINWSSLSSLELSNGEIHEAIKK